MSENQEPVARILDFSQVGETSSSLFQRLSSIEFPVREEIEEQVDALLPRFNPGLAFNQQPRNRISNTRMRQWLLVGNKINKKNCKSIFNPKSLDEFYNTRCAPGCTRIFRRLVDNPEISIHNIMVTLPFHKLRNHLFELINPFNKLPKSDFKVPSEVSEYLHTTYIYKKADAYRSLWESFANIRYQMQRLVNAWLNKKCQKKILPIPNYETMEDPTPNNCIEWTDISNRCVYRIHGDTLIKSMKMYLHHSDYGFPDPLTPKNPTTNAPFTLGQLIHLQYEIYAWCGKNKKPVPSILTKYHDATFNLDTLCIKNRPEMTYHVCRELFKEMDDEDAIETWMDMIEKFAPLPSFSRDRIEKEVPIWIKSLNEVETETNKKGKELLKKWEAILPDLVQYSRFNYFNRSDWKDEAQVKKIVKILWVNTYHHIRVYIESKKVEELAIIHAIQAISNQSIEYSSILYVDDSFAFDFLLDPPSPPALPVIPLPPVSMTQGLGSEIITFITSMAQPSTSPASPTEESFESVD